MYIVNGSVYAQTAMTKAMAPNATSSDADCRRPAPLAAGTGPGPLVGMPVTVDVFDDVVNVVELVVVVMVELDVEEAEEIELETDIVDVDEEEGSVAKVELEGDGVDLEVDGDADPVDCPKVDRVPVAVDPVADPLANPNALPVREPVGVPVELPDTEPVAEPVLKPDAVPVTVPLALPVALPVTLPVGFETGPVPDREGDAPAVPVDPCGDVFAACDSTFGTMNGTPAGDVARGPSGTVRVSDWPV